MNFILRNLEALGEEVAAALDDLADEVTGRTRAKCHLSDEDEDDGASDDRSIASVERAGGWAASDGSAASDTASDDGVAPCCRDGDVLLATAPPAEALPMPGAAGSPKIAAHTQRRRRPLGEVRRTRGAIDDDPDAAEPPSSAPPVPPPPVVAAGPEAAGGATLVVPLMPPSIVSEPPDLAITEAPVQTAPAESSQSPRKLAPRRTAPPTLRKSSDFDLCDREFRTLPHTPTVEGEYLVL